MNTKFIGIKDFRQNISRYAKQAKRGKTRVVITKHDDPIFELKPIAEEEYSDEVVARVLAAEADVAKGNYYTQEEVMEELGLS